MGVSQALPLLSGFHFSSLWPRSTLLHSGCLSRLSQVLNPPRSESKRCQASCSELFRITACQERLRGELAPAAQDRQAWNPGTWIVVRTGPMILGYGWHKFAVFWLHPWDIHEVKRSEAAALGGEGDGPVGNRSVWDLQKGGPARKWFGMKLAGRMTGQMSKPTKTQRSLLVSVQFSTLSCQLFRRQTNLLWS